MTPTSLCAQRVTNLLEIGRLRTLSSTVESRKFKSQEDAQPKRPRWVYCYHTVNISRRGLTRVAYPWQGDARARQWDKRTVVTPTSFFFIKT